MVSFKLCALAFASAVSAVSFSEWCQHNGLVTSYNQFIKEDPTLVNMIEQTNPVTVFIPTDAAFKRWQSEPGVSTQSFNATSDTFLYMAVRGSWDINQLYTQKSLTSLLQGEQLHVSTSGAYPQLSVIISSGTNYKTNSTAGVINFDFNIENGKIQLVDTVFSLPTNILNKANKNRLQVPSSAKRNVAVAALSFINAGIAMLM